MPLIRARFPSTFTTWITLTGFGVQPDNVNIDEMSRLIIDNITSVADIAAISSVVGEAYLSDGSKLLTAGSQFTSVALTRVIEFANISNSDRISNTTTANIVQRMQVL